MGHALIIVSVTYWFVLHPVALYAMDFAPNDDIESLDMDADVGRDDSDSDLDSNSAGVNLDEADVQVEDDQSDIRVTRPRALGLFIGEVLPHSAAGLTWVKIKDPQSAWSASVSRGDFRATEQGDGEAWFSMQAKSWSMAGRYYWWPSPYFPFALVPGLVLESASGSLKSQTGSKGKFQTETVYMVGGIVMSHTFKFGLWVEWSLLSASYGQNLRGRYQTMTGSQMTSVRKNLNGVKIQGFANLTLGYAW